MSPEGYRSIIFNLVVDGINNTMELINRFKWIVLSTFRVHFDYAD